MHNDPTMRNLIKSALIVGTLTSATLVVLADTPAKPKTPATGSAAGSAAGSGSAAKPTPPAGTGSGSGSAAKPKAGH